MKSDRKKHESNERRVELKYCEHCGALWLREPGAGVVYCENCQPKMADLPTAQRKPPGRLTLPVRPRTVVESYDHLGLADGDDMEFEASGGAA